jgi:ATP-dependent DNA ligase
VVDSIAAHGFPRSKSRYPKPRFGGAFYRMMARRDAAGIRLLTRNGYDWAQKYPLIVEAVNYLKVRSCLLDGEVVCCDERGLTTFQFAPPPP